MAANGSGYDAWNPGLKSEVPPELLHLCTIFRPENSFGGLAGITESHTLTGIPRTELAALRPRRLALHETLIRVTADFAVPDGSRIEDLGIKFREITSVILDRYVEPEMPKLEAVFEQARQELKATIDAALERVAFDARPGAALLRRLKPRRGARPAAEPVRTGWGVSEIADYEAGAAAAGDEMAKLAYRALARVMSGLFITNGRAWGTRDYIASVAVDLACNDIAPSRIGVQLEPILRRAADEQGYGILPRQQHPEVINTKGPSASGKSTLRPLQKALAQRIGLRWTEFALISPDIWRKQLLDYGSLGAAYKYAASFTGDELQIIDHKLDRYMEAKNRRGEMSHLLIDRFRFDSVAKDGDEEGSNFLTRFGHRVQLFFVITAPESLVERAWKRGLEVGRFKAVDDTLAHAVEAYTGMPDVFFTWIKRSDKHIRFEFLDNSVPLGQRPRTAAFGDNVACNILDVGCMINIERYCRINVWAGGPDGLYTDRSALAAELNVGILSRCVKEFREVNFADQRSGRIYLRIRSGRPTLIDPAALSRAAADPDTRDWLQLVAPGAFDGQIAATEAPLLLQDDPAGLAPTLGRWASIDPA